jgi:hypothetical protein
MNSKTEKVISTGLTLARDAGAAAVEAGSKVGTQLVRVAAPKAKELASKMKGAVSVGAGLAIAKKGGKVALAVARKNPIATAAAAVALTGVGVAVMVARTRTAAKAAAGAGKAAPKKLAAKNMRGSTAPAKKAPAKRASAPRARKPAGASTH